MDLRLDRLSIRVAGLAAHEARRLAELVAGHLAAAETPVLARALERLRVTVAPHPGESVETMAERVAAQLRYAIARST
jgi:hypothetical protein